MPILSENYTLNKAKKYMESNGIYFREVTQCSNGGYVIEGEFLKELIFIKADKDGTIRRLSPQGWEIVS